MKPLNDKERRKAFWKFALLFFLAIIPICIAIFLYGKVDKAENTFLRKEYVEKAQGADTDGSTADRDKYYTSLKASISELNKYLISQDPNFVRNQLYGSITTKINPIEQELISFDRDIRSKAFATKADSALYDVLKFQVDNLNRLNKIYDGTSNKIVKVEEKLDDVEDKLETCLSKSL